MKEGISKGMNMKWSLYMSSNQQNLTIGSIRLKSDYRVVKISLTTGLGSYLGMEFNEIPHTSTVSLPMMLCDSMCVFHFRGLSVGVAAGETLEKFPRSFSD